MKTSNGTWPLCVLSSIEKSWRKEEINVAGRAEDIPDFKRILFEEDDEGGGGGGGARGFDECERWIAWICCCCCCGGGGDGGCCCCPFIISLSLGDETHLY